MTFRLTLLSWLSPAFPTGGFAYSAGLETVAHDSVQTLEDLQSWFSGQIENGPVWNDAVLLAASWRAINEAQLLDIAELARALVASSERLDEMNGQGTSFADASAHWLPEALPRDLPYAVALGAAAKLVGLPLRETLEAYLHAFAANQLQAAIRLSLTGQNGAAKILAALAPVIGDATNRAAISTLEDLGSAGILADIASMNHEILPMRLFRS
ncbi:MAG: urease accessory protein UreF [Notoacmeibacter sp.]